MSLGGVIIVSLVVMTKVSLSLISVKFACLGFDRTFPVFEDVEALVWESRLLFG